eukprot:3586170-Rhodomonas_salina.1
MTRLSSRAAVVTPALKQSSDRAAVPQTCRGRRCALRCRPPTITSAASTFRCPMIWTLKSSTS